MKIEQIWPGLKVEKAIGQGSYGTVYKCVYLEGEPEKYSAVKVISIPQNGIEYGASSSDGTSDIKEDYKEIVEEFSKEIKILESLKGNTNIVSIEDSRIVEKEDGIGWQIFIRMELLTDFNAYLSQHKFEKEDILKLGMDLCQALKVCGEKKIIHRDIKPENIFVDGDGNFKLGDFGVAKQLERTEASMSRKGTYNYMAPEVFNSRKYDSRADIYSLALVMYRLFNNNRLPFIDTEKQIVKYSEREEAFEKRITGTKIPPAKDADENVNELLLRALEYKAEDRYKSVDEFYNELQKIAGGKKIRKRFRRLLSSPAGATAVSAVLVISIVAGSLFFIFNHKNSTESKLIYDEEIVNEEATAEEKSIQQGSTTYSVIEKKTEANNNTDYDVLKQYTNTIHFLDKELHTLFTERRLSDEEREYIGSYDNTGEGYI